MTPISGFKINYLPNLVKDGSGDPSYVSIMEQREKSLFGFHWISDSIPHFHELENSSYNALAELKATITLSNKKTQEDIKNKFQQNACTFHLRARAYQMIYADKPEIVQAAKDITDRTPLYINQSTLRLLDEAIDKEFQATSVKNPSGLNSLHISAA